MQFFSLNFAGDFKKLSNNYNYFSTDEINRIKH